MKGKTTILKYFVFFTFIMTTALSFQGLSLAEQAATSPEIYLPKPLQTKISKDGRSIPFGLPLRAFVADPNRQAPPRRIPPPQWLKNIPDSKATAKLSVTYVGSGGSDPWGERCYAFPSAAKAAFNAAADIWAKTLKSSVPITIRACWGNLGSPYILGYSGGGPLRRDFSGATRANTWYSGALANSLYGSDLDTGSYDMHITYNSTFSWYYGTDGNTPGSKYDLMTVVLHEIGHGLNFSGSMQYSTSGLGRYGYGTGLPNIYDTFVKDGSGKSLISYTNTSYALGSALTSNNLWFHGAKAKSANGGSRVKIYAPSSWAQGSSFSHLDYATFNNTSNQLMVYAVSSGESIHSPGPVALGLLKDLGWSAGGSVSALPFLQLLMNSTSPVPNGDFESGKTVWSESSSNGWSIIGQWSYTHGGSWSAWLGGGDNEISTISQGVQVPAEFPHLQFYHRISSTDTCGWDYAYVQVNGSNRDTINLCTTNNTAGWVKQSVNLSAYAGQFINLKFRATTDSISNSSSWYIDDVVFSQKP